VLADHFWIGVGEAAHSNGNGSAKPGHGRKNGKH
jgi:hypothetical protein